MNANEQAACCQTCPERAALPLHPPSPARAQAAKNDLMEHVPGIMAHLQYPNPPPLPKTAVCLTLAGQWPLWQLGWARGRRGLNRFKWDGR